MGITGALCAAAIALIALFRHLLVPAAGGGAVEWLSGTGKKMRALHSGHVGDYVAWLTVGVAVFGAVLAAVLQ